MHIPCQALRPFQPQPLPGLHTFEEVGGDRAAAAAVGGRVASAKADGEPKTAGKKAETAGLGGLEMTRDEREISSQLPGN